MVGGRWTGLVVIFTLASASSTAAGDERPWLDAVAPRPALGMELGAELAGKTGPQVGVRGQYMLRIGASPLRYGPFAGLRWSSLTPDTNYPAHSFDSLVALGGWLLQLRLVDASPVAVHLSSHLGLGIGVGYPVETRWSGTVSSDPSPPVHWVGLLKMGLGLGVRLWSVVLMGGVDLEPRLRGNDYERALYPWLRAHVEWPLGP